MSRPTKKSEPCGRRVCRKARKAAEHYQEREQLLLEEKKSLENVIATLNEENVATLKRLAAAQGEERLKRLKESNTALQGEVFRHAQAHAELAKQVLEERQATRVPTAPEVAWQAEGDELVLTTNAGELRVRPARPGRIDRAEVLLQGVPVKGAASWEEAVRRGAHLAAALGDLEPVE